MKKIILSNDDLKILERIQQVQNTIRIEKNIKVPDDSKTMYGVAELEIDDDIKLDIYNLSEFLSILKHFNTKPKSPTASTSSISNTSGSICAATAKPKRTFIPEL